MKKILTLVILIGTTFDSFSQLQWEITFDDSANLYRIQIDTSNQANIWQIGEPAKSFFNSAYSEPNAIVTDTILTYPVNTNSSFSFGAFYWWIGWQHELSFRYKMDCDTLNDYGKVEYSVDTGKTFHNILEEPYIVYDSSYHIIATDTSSDTVLFTGKSNGWYLATFVINSSLIDDDSIIFRFTFKSDSIQHNRDGWLIDNIDWTQAWEGFQERSMDYQIFPNPTTDFLHITSKLKIKEISLITELGQAVLTKSIEEIPVILNLKDLMSGIYILKIVDEEYNVLVKKIIKSK